MYEDELNCGDEEFYKKMLDRWEEEDREREADPKAKAKPNGGAKTEARKLRFPLVAFKDIRRDTERRGYLVKGLLPDSGLAVIWGPPKCGKSFWTMDVAFHIALGWEYRGRRVQQAPVVYIALEGRNGIPDRADGFRQHHGVEDMPFHLMTTGLDLAKQVSTLIADIETQLGDTKPGAIFIDTLNRSLVGSESKDEDMAAYLAAAGKLEQKFNCLVAIVHHCGIDATRPRGHTSLSGAVEVQLAVEKPGDRQVMVTVELAKDMPEGAEIFSKLETVDLGTDRDGDPIASLIVLPADASAFRPTASRKLSDRQRLALDALTECYPHRRQTRTSEPWIAGKHHRGADRDMARRTVHPQCAPARCQKSPRRLQTAARSTPRP
jgi:AAA domain